MLAMQVVMKTLSKECKVKKKKTNNAKKPKNTSDLCPALLSSKKGQLILIDVFVHPLPASIFSLHLLSFSTNKSHQNFHLKVSLINLYRSVSLP